MIALLDVNIPAALFDSSHVYQEAAHRWFGTNRKYSWATCLLTESAFARIFVPPGISWTLDQP